jgi:hypothetical protein
MIKRMISYMTREGAFALAMLGVSPLAVAAHGFRPGLWMVTSISTGAIQTTSRGPACLRHLSGGGHAVATLGPQMPLSGPMGVRITHTPLGTKVTWHDRMRQGPAVTIDHGWYQFHEQGSMYVMRGQWIRQEVINGQQSIVREALHGHWIGASCPAALPAPVTVSPTLQGIKADAAKLQAAVNREQAALKALKNAGEVP